MSKIKQQPALFVVFVVSALLAIDLFAPWQEVAGAQSSGFSGWGIPTMVFVAFVFVESSLQARGIVKKIPVPPPVLILLPSVLALITTAIKFVVDSEGRQAAAYIGLALAVILAVAGYVNARATINMIRQMRQAAKASR